MISGRKVRYTGSSEAQVNYGGHDDPRELLTIGEIYTVDHAIVHDWRTEFHLVGFEDKDFNSVCFDIIEQEV